MQSQQPASSGLPPFADAVVVFRTFLRGQGAPNDVLWVTRRDLTSHRRRVWVRQHRSEQPTAAEAIYAGGRRKGLGVSLRGVCRVGNATAAYVWVPRDVTAASYAMQPPSLKCQVPTPLPTATPVSSVLGWYLLRLVNQCRRFGNLTTLEMPRGQEGAA